MVVGPLNRIATYTSDILVNGTQQNSYDQKSDSSYDVSISTSATPDPVSVKLTAEDHNMKVNTSDSDPTQHVDISHSHDTTVTGYVSLNEDVSENWDFDVIVNGNTVATKSVSSGASSGDTFSATGSLSNISGTYDVVIKIYNLTADGYYHSFAIYSESDVTIDITPSYTVDGVTKS